MRTGVEQTRSQKEKAQREESKADESPPPDAHLPKPKEELERRPVLALALVSFTGCALLASAAVLIAYACTEGRDDGYEGHHDRILRLPNGACWKVLAYWREAA